MLETYFQRLRKSGKTRLWINNPTLSEVKDSLEQGVFACTTNPTYGANLLKRDREYALGELKNCKSQGGSQAEIADRLQQRYIARLMHQFHDHYEKTGGQEGWVSLQSNPYLEEDWTQIVESAISYRKLGPNFIAKIPATETGLKAIEEVLCEGIPVIATEIFAVSQMIATCDCYSRAALRSGKRPAFFITHITGIFDEYLQNQVQSQGIKLDAGLLSHAGLALARHQYHLFKSRGYAGSMLGGGARSPKHFTGLVGGEMHITVNWSTVEEILQMDPPLDDTISRSSNPNDIDTLCGKLPDFKKAWNERGLALEEFAEYGPVQLFRNMFIKGWDAMEKEIGEN